MANLLNAVVPYNVDGGTVRTLHLCEEFVVMRIYPVFEYERYVFQSVAEGGTLCDNLLERVADLLCGTVSVQRSV